MDKPRVPEPDCGGCFLIIVVGLLAWAFVAYVHSAKSDKERIEALEKQVKELRDD